MAHSHAAHAARTNPIKRLWALIVATAMLIILPAGAMTAAAADPIPDENSISDTYMKLTLTRTDNLGESVSAGATLTYDISYENIGDKVFTVYPTESNLSGVLDASTAGHPVCRWRNLGIGTTQSCSGKATHVVTEADKTAGGFTPTFTAVATTNADAKPTAADTLQTVTVTGSKVTVTTPDPNAKYLTVTATRVDGLGENLTVGQKIRYKFEYTNTSDRQIAVYPKDSNLTNTDVTATANCRIGTLAAKGTSQCDNTNLAYHTVSAEDVIKGTFTPTTLFQATTDREGGTVLQDNIVVTSTPVTIKAADKDEASTAKAYKDGESRYLAKARQLGANESYRIPAIAETNTGRMLTAWDLRPVGGDAPNPNSIVMRYSDDQGKSWSALKMVAEGRNTTSRHGYSDPSFVVDRETGTIFLFFVKSYNAGFANSQVGVDPTNRNVLQAAVTKSTDNGETWSEPQIITDQVTAGHETTWKSRFATSGAGIQLKYGAHKGRLIQQFAVKPTTGSINYAVSIYSDDHGDSWKVGGVIDSTNMDENKVVELSNGDVMVNARPGTAGYRKIAISHDGGQTYGAVTEDKQLPDPNNNAHILRAYPNAPENSAKAKILLFSGPQANNVGRKNGVVRISFDDGKTWSSGKLYKSESMAYSVTTVLQDGSYAMLYEGDWVNGSGVDSHEMMYLPFSMAWLGYLDVTATADAASVTEGGKTVTVPVTVKNNSSDDYTMLKAAIADLPTGWTADDATVEGGLEAGKTATVDVTVHVPDSAQSGQKVTGTIKFTGTYANGVNVSATGTTPMDNDTLSSFDDSTVDINVTEKEPEPVAPTIEKITADAKDQYKVGEKFTDLKVFATMSDKNIKELASDEYTVKAVDAEGNEVSLTEPFAKAGTFEVTVTSTADPKATATFEIVVAELTPTPTPTIDSIGASAKSKYTVGETFGELTVTAFMSDDTEQPVELKDVTVTASYLDAGGEVDLSKPFERAGEVQVVVRLKADPSKEDTFKVTVKAKDTTPVDPHPEPEPEPEQPSTPTTPVKKPALSNTGSSIATMVIAVIAMTAAAGMMTVIRRRRA